MHAGYVDYPTLPYLKTLWGIINSSDVSGAVLRYSGGLLSWHWQKAMEAVKIHCGIVANISYQKKEPTIIIRIPNIREGQWKKWVWKDEV
jgi:hypothetical protein